MLLLDPSMTKTLSASHVKIFPPRPPSTSSKFKFNKYVQISLCCSPIALRLIHTTHHMLSFVPPPAIIDPSHQILQLGCS